MVLPGTGVAATSATWAETETGTTASMATATASMNTHGTVRVCIERNEETKDTPVLPDAAGTSRKPVATSRRLSRPSAKPSTTGEEIGYANVIMALYHFSEDPAIPRFVPRPPLARPEIEPLVWAIDDWHAPVYFLPRDCPRVCFWPLPTTTDADYARFFATVSGRMVIAIESAWLGQLRTTQLYRYLMPEETFVDTHDHGVHVSREPVVPLYIEPVGDLLAALTGAGVEMRIMPSLVPLGRAIIQTTLHFSLIRMRNAEGWDDSGQR